jgi:hypothetical protein
MRSDNCLNLQTMTVRPFKHKHMHMRTAKVAISRNLVHSYISHLESFDGSELLHLTSDVTTYTATLVQPLLLLYWIKMKVKLSLCFNWTPCHEGTLGEWKHRSMHSLASALDGGEWSASHPGRFTPMERASEGGWVGSRAVLDAAVKRKISSPRRESKLIYWIHELLIANQILDERYTMAHSSRAYTECVRNT